MIASRVGLPVLGILSGLVAGMCLFGPIAGVENDIPPLGVVRVAEDPLAEPSGASLRGRWPTETSGGLALSPSDVDLGSLRMGEVGLAAVEIRNPTEGPVAFRVVAPCGCVEVTLEPDVEILAAGATVNLLVAVRTENVLGPFQEVVTVSSLDGVHAGQCIQVHGIVSRGIQIYCESGGALPSLLGRARPVDLRLRGAHDLGHWEPVGLLSWPDGQAEKAQALPHTVESVVPGGEYGTAFRILAELPPTGAVGRRRMWVQVQTTLGRSPWPRTLISYDVHPAVRPALARLHLGVVRPGRQSRGRVRILPGIPEVRFGLRSAHVRPREGATGDPGFDSACARDELGWYVEVWFRGGDGGGRRREAVLVVETDHSDVPRVEIPVEAVIQFAGRR